MHGSKRLWASWNYRLRDTASKQDPVSITYYMNRLQRLKVKKDYFVTLNAEHLIDRTKIIYQIDYSHPVFTSASVGSQEQIQAINGTNNTYFCGAHLGYGFHEDGIKSAVTVCEAFGLRL